MQMRRRPVGEGLRETHLGMDHGHRIWFIGKGFKLKLLYSVLSETATQPKHQSVNIK